MKRWPWLTPAVAGISFVFFAASAWRAVVMGREVRRAEAEVAARRVETVGGPLNDKGLEGRVSQWAVKAGLRQLLGVSSREDRKTIAIEWEGSQQSSLSFLARLQAPDAAGPCVSLLVTSAGSSPGALRVRAVLEARSSAGAAGALQGEGATTAAPRLARNVFAPLWRDAAEALAQREERERKKEEEARAAAQEKMDRERRDQQEAQQAQNKKRSIESQWLLTGIVNNGREPLAFVNQQSAGGRALMVRSGDAVDEARVTAIDESKGEVRLDYQGKFEVVLKLNAPPTGGVR